MKQISSDQMITSAQAAWLLEKFKHDELWYELTEEQQERDNWKSTVTSILHRRARWKHAAQAILQHPLPMLREENQSDYFPEHIASLRVFANTKKRRNLLTCVCMQEKIYIVHVFACSLRYFAYCTAM